MLRAISHIRKDPLAYLGSTWRTYGDVVQFPIPRPPSYLVNEPTAVRKVLVDNAKNYTKDTIQYRSLSLVTGEGLLTADGVAWRRHRRLIQPAFHHTTADSLVSIVMQSTEELAASLRAKGGRHVIDVDEFMMQAALNIVGKALFGTDLGPDSSRLTHATLRALDVVVARARVPITPPSWMPTPANRVLASAVAELDSAVEAMVRARGDEPGSDLLGMLLAATDDDGRHLTTQEIRDEMVTFIVAGHETVASALTWAFGLLATHPEHQESLAREAAGIDVATMATVGQLPYARAVYDETLRLYPPAWLITRAALNDDELAGVKVPGGALVIMSPYLVHRHPEAWADPEGFMPSRFLGENPRNSFIPFGAGPRLCIGRDFSYVEAVLMLSVLARDFDWKFPKGGSLPLGNPLVTIRPRQPLILEVNPRA